MIDDERIERLLRARPASDGTYEPGLADLLDGGRRESQVTGVLRLRQGDPAPARLIALALLVGAALVAATAMFVGGRADDRLVVVEPPPQTVALEPDPIFPVEGVTAILDRFHAARWAATPGVVVDIAIQRDERFWAAASGVNASTVLGQGINPGLSTLRVGGTEHLFLTAVVLALVDRGQVDLDAPISRYVSVWPAGDTITTRNLLNGSSGVASFGDPIEDLARLVAAEPERDWTAADALRIASDRTSRFQVGAGYSPADTDDVLLTSIIEAVTGYSLDLSATEEFASLFPQPQAVLPVGYDGVELVTDIGFWDPTGSGVLVEAADLPRDVLTVLGTGRNLATPVGVLARKTDDVHTASLGLSLAAIAMLDLPFEDGGLGGSAMCPCTGDAKDGVGLVGHTGPYTSLSVYVPSERLTIAMVVNAPVSDDDLQDLLQEIHDLVWPAIS